MRRTVALLAALCSSAALAQSYPSKPVRVYLPQPPGAGVDIILRKAHEDIQQRLGQPLIVENRAGGNSVVATEACAKAAPDGYTICVLNSDPLVAAQYLFAKLPFNAEKDFRPITNLYYILNGLFVKAAVPVANIKEFEAYARANPGKLNQAILGPRSSQDMSRLWLSERWNTKFEGIPYPGGPQVFNALAAGDADWTLQGAYGGLALLKSNKVKLLAVTGSKRLAAFPEVPTFIELGMPDLPSGKSWWGLLAPAALATPIVTRLNTEYVRTFREPKFVEFLAELVTEPNVGSPEEFAALMRSDRERNQRLVKQFNWQAE